MSLAVNPSASLPVVVRSSFPAASEGVWSRQGRYLVVDLGGEIDEEVPRSIDARIEWKGPLTATQAAAEPGGGLYYVIANGKPCYIGQTVSFRMRVAAHVRSRRCSIAPPQAWSIYVGRVQPVAGSVSAKRDPRQLRLDVEHAVIRNVARPHGRLPHHNCSGHSPLLNRSSICPFRVVGILRVDNQGKVPVGLARLIAAQNGTLYEFAA